MEAAASIILGRHSDTARPLPRFSSNLEDPQHVVDGTSFVRRSTESGYALQLGSQSEAGKLAATAYTTSTHSPRSLGDFLNSVFLNDADNPVIDEIRRVLIDGREAVKAAESPGDAGLRLMTAATAARHDPRTDFQATSRSGLQRSRGSPPDPEAFRARPIAFDFYREEV
jgi:hypothetical protein